MLLADMLSNLRIELQDVGMVYHTNDDLIRAISKTVNLMSRFIPKKSVAETRIGGDVTSETLAISSSTGILAHPPIKPGTLTITGEVEGTDYEVNYLTGVITEVGSNLADGNYTVKYSRDSRIYNFGSLISDCIQIERVELPAGDNPPTRVAFEVVGDYLIVGGRDTDLGENDHLRVVYLCKWTMPTYSVVGDYPSHLDDVIIIGASGQALIYKAEKYTQQAIVEIGLMNAAADAMATPLGDINIALDKVNTYLVTNGTTDNAADVLANITDDVADLRTAIKTALDLYSTYVTNGSTAPDAKKYLADGDDLINAATRGDNVAGNYAKFAETAIAMYGALLSNATTRVENIRTYIEESEEWRKIGETFVAEATQRIQEVYSYSLQAQQYYATSQQYLSIAGRFLASGQAKINEFLVALGQKPEYFQLKTASGQFD
jgi:hypothetical protein